MAIKQKSSIFLCPFLKIFKNICVVIANILFSSSIIYHINEFQISVHLLPWITLISRPNFFALSTISSSSSNNSTTLGNFFPIYAAYYSTNCIVFAKNTTFLFGNYFILSHINIIITSVFPRPVSKYMIEFRPIPF